MNRVDIRLFLNSKNCLLIAALTLNATVAPTLSAAWSKPTAFREALGTREALVTCKAFCSDHLVLLASTGLFSIAAIVASAYITCTQSRKQPSQRITTDTKSANMTDNEKKENMSISENTKPSGLQNQSDFVYAIDLHGVLLHLSLTRAIARVWHTPQKTYLFKLFLSPTFWKQSREIASHTATTERQLELLTKKYPRLAQYQEAFFDVCNQQDIDQELFSILMDLKKKGYRFIAASNIGEKTYQKLLKLYPQLNELFSASFVSGKDSAYTTKRNPAYFDSLKNFVTTHFGAGTAVYLIDNTKKNVHIAQERGIQAHLFVSPVELKKFFVDRSPHH